jgi:ankyrin repeat protein
LFKIGVDFNNKSRNGWLPLHIGEFSNNSFCWLKKISKLLKAAKMDKVNILEYFHKQGIKMTVRNDENASPLHIGLFCKI